MIKTEVARYGQLIANQPDGYYIIPDIDMKMVGNEKLRLLNVLLFNLQQEYHQYQWWTTELFGQPGIRVNWRKR